MTTLNDIKDIKNVNYNIGKCFGLVILLCFPFIIIKGINGMNDWYNIVASNYPWCRDQVFTFFNEGVITVNDWYNIVVRILPWCRDQVSILLGVKIMNVDIYSFCYTYLFICILELCRLYLYSVQKKKLSKEKNTLCAKIINQKEILKDIESILVDGAYNDTDTKYLKYEDPEWTMSKLKKEAIDLGVPYRLLRTINKHNLKYVLRIVDQNTKIADIIDPDYPDGYETE